ncbi:MAG: patatin-like phospholipase family protein [Chromatiales bacterium]
MSDRTTVSLVLGSGGARGLAHIGIINWLDEHGFQIRSIAGSSMGALVGGIYAAGKLDIYARWVSSLERMDVVRLLDFSFRRSGLIKGERVMDTLRELIGEYRIEDLPVSFTAVATDVDEQKEFWIARGSLFDAIRASIAIPTVFTPKVIQGHTLVDGGLVNPIPIAPTLRDNTDLTIAVNLSARPIPVRQVAADRPTASPDDQPDAGYRRQIAQFIESVQRRLGVGDDEGEAEQAEEQDIFDLVSKSLETMQNSVARFQLAAYSPDLTIDVPRDACSFYEFHRAREMIALGWDRAEAVLGRQGAGDA